ncbi:MAG TPA: glycosyltransferase [Terriglobales bacterium]|nr:glycosyltransferase [Terriglobales bacterium]
MIRISLCMIVKNEEGILQKCLSSVTNLVDEIIIMDTGSTDKTKEVAAAFTDKIYDFTWSHDFSAARNAAFDKATMDYILWLDADDVLPPEEAEKFAELKKTLPPDVDAVYMGYNAAFDDAGRPTFSYARERLVKRSCGFRWREPVHEYLAIGGKILQSDVCINHVKEKWEANDRNLRIYERRLSKGEPLTPRGTYYYARELRDNGRFEEAAAVFRRFLDDGQGWVEDNITACEDLAGCLAATGKPKEALTALLESFRYDTPRAELCCRIGYHHKERSDYRQARFWFELALNLKKPEPVRGFYQADCWGYIPSLECAVCCDKLGDFENAVRYNELAATFKPGSQAVAYNRRYFASRKESENNAKRGSPM